MPPFDAPHGELYYWPNELVENVRSSTLRQQEQRQEDNAPPLFERLRRTLEQPQPQSQDEEPLQEPRHPNGEIGARVRFASSDPQKTVEVVQPAQQPPPNEGEGNGEQESSIEANGEQHTSSSERTQQNEEEPDLCGMCCSQRRNAVCAPCGHRAGCHACLRTVMHTSHACPFCRLVCAPSCESTTKFIKSMDIIRCSLPNYMYKNYWPKR
ncbi:Zinc finger, RING/FYVE/PHD-type [Phytophthora cactorum]|nr:Zinc finger, RING/FYVE/PHD-type [Phytophthora cactorum]